MSAAATRPRGLRLASTSDVETLKVRVFADELLRILDGWADAYGRTLQIDEINRGVQLAMVGAASSMFVVRLTVEDVDAYRLGVHRNRRGRIDAEESSAMLSNMPAAHVAEIVKLYLR